VTVLDEAGREAARRPVAFRLNEDDRHRQREQPKIHYSPLYSDLFRVWAADLDGDGADELLLFEGDKLLALRSDLKTILWERPLPDAACELLSILPSGPAVRLGGRVLGLDGKTGRSVWSCAGSGTPLALLASADSAELPRVVFDLGDDATVCRRAMPVGDSAQASGFVPFAPIPGDDPRFVRPLPWNDLSDLPPLFPASPFGIFLWLAGLGFAGIIVPLGFVRLAARWRSWRPAAIALAWVALVWGGLVAWYWLELNNDATLRIAMGGYSTFVLGVGKEFGKLALVGLPAVAFVAVALSWLGLRLWSRIGLLVGVSAIFAVIIAVAWVRWAGLDQEQRYATSGWWSIAPAGAYAAGLILTISWLAGTVWGWRKLRPSRKGASCGLA
jgi:hypothetical protein